MTVEFKLESSWTTYPLIFFDQRKDNEEASLIAESQTFGGLGSRVRREASWVLKISILGTTVQPLV